MKHQRLVGIFPCRRFSVSVVLLVSLVVVVTVSVVVVVSLVVAVSFGAGGVVFIVLHVEEQTRSLCTIRTLAARLSSRQ